MAVGAHGTQACEHCGSALARDQRYCLGCGARIGQRSPQLEELVRRAGGRSDRRPAAAGQTPGQTSAATAPVPGARAGAWGLAGLRLPSAGVSALLVSVFLGFGVILGGAGSAPTATLASAHPHLKVVLPPSGSPPASSSDSEGSGASAEAEAPPAEAEPTPEPSPAPVAPKTAAAQPAPSSGSGSGSSEGDSSAPAAAPAKELPPIKHVFVIMLSDEPYAAAFGPASTAPYLSGTLERQGELLAHYDAVAHEELANEVALLSGQGATLETAANCPQYAQIAPASAGADEQVLGNGCVYPASTQTLAGQLTAKHLTWRAYVQGTDEAGAPAGACAHPVLGQADPSAAQGAGTGPFATFRNPFVYFQSILASPACAADDVGLAALKGDLASAASTPSFSYIVPDRCDDGNPTPCTAGAPAGMTPADTFIKQVVPEITSSKAYKESGLLVITVDEAPSSGEFADSSSCCGQPLFPNAPSKTPAGAPRGGGAVGALLLSPFVKSASTSQEAFNHFSLLRTVEDLFGLKHLGYAGLSAVKSFEPSMFTAAKG